MMNSMNKNVTNNVKVVSTDAINTSGGNECNASVINADTLTNADNYPCCGGDFKIPKVLTEFIVQIDTESVIKLNEPAYEIKRIEKQVFLTQCRYIPPTDKVFLEGYIRKNIEYATRTCSRGSAIGGSIKDTTVHIPFKVYTKVNFNPLNEYPNKAIGYYIINNKDKSIKEYHSKTNPLFVQEIVYEEKQGFKWRTVDTELSITYNYSSQNNKYFISNATLKQNIELFNRKNEKTIYEVEYNLIITEPFSEIEKFETNVKSSKELFKIDIDYDKKFWLNQNQLPLTNELNEFIKNIKKYEKEYDIISNF